MYNKTTILVALTMATAGFADETFEINRKNCNLPISEIKKQVTDTEEQKDVLNKCMKKASEENWMKKTLLTGRS